ncbi:hypothetical protein J2S40_000800 [Nocardioides luteus]|uniref:hypothetical protein n=1 Tax=Nocardioides luteus TaxID=1844 RepID=UPI00166B61C0|nr:hypothetical protein [Nocardioides luteus]MDR7309742.1 hypothetical protein [Nocardioides luteus]
MARSLGWRTPLAAVALLTAVAGLSGLAGCGSESVGSVEPEPPARSSSSPDRTEDELLVNGRVTCDQDVSSDQAKSTIERVGGLQQPTWSVRFAESTAAGVIVLVAGDLEDARPRLFDDYDVAAIVGLEKEQSRAEDFRAVRDAVREICA